MSNLKTLKDFEIYWKEINGLDITDITYQIRAEAIKWYKSFHKEDYDLKNFIQHFFNITEEELK